MKHAADDIISRLGMIDKDFSDILEISAKCGYLTKLLKTTYRNADITATDMSPLLLDSFRHDRKLLIRHLSKPAYREEFKGDTEHSATAYTLVREDSSTGSTSKLPLEVEFGKMSIDDEDLEFPKDSFDLIIYSLGLHWINDVQSFLSNIRTFLKPDGIFIGNFVGGNSLKNLRKSLIDAETASGFKHSPHISSFIHFDHVPMLLSQAGFAEVIVDYENIELKFDNPLALMKEIKNIGESNSLNASHNYAISKKMFSLLQNYTNGFEDNINLISFIASSNKNSIRLKLL
ncbi:palindromic element RPE1 domain-containing protein [Rickettsia sp. TH2014]|uniref:palindromic element RPE1 domain-containing protein n=1 Tax=Rickettsia sp. TH2014 TaxID=1967503 RepID=UPI0035322143